MHHLQMHTGLCFCFEKIETLLTTWWPMWNGGKEMTQRRTAANSAGGHQACGDVAGGPAILSLGVGDCAVLLSEMKPQLTLVSEVEVTFFTLKRKTKRINFNHFARGHFNPPPTHTDTVLVNRWHSGLGDENWQSSLHDKASLRCECACGS